MVLRVIDRRISSDDNLVIGDNGDYKILFDFDNEWIGKVNTARFINNGHKVDVLIDSDNTCNIPIEVLKKGYLGIGVFNDVMATKYFEIFVTSSIKEINGAVPDPTPGIYSQILKQIEDIAKGKIPEEDLERIIEDYLDKHPIEAGISEDEAKVIVRDYITAHKSELKGEPGRTPVKGVDYYTESDKAELVSAVIEALPMAESEVY